MFGGYTAASTVDQHTNALGGNGEGALGIWKFTMFAGPGGRALPAWPGLHLSNHCSAAPRWVVPTAQARPGNRGLLEY